ncbi:hypothetical protein CRT60_00255 [Azospirillum palustre]|uniref:Terminase n=1 Tax=Azospirillum palustre TaxID=2044885 RepID=A0A2B8BNZ5_9PROT|nr:terminase small subunit [Azospirillum palustre]PGH59449.1 hypothetical protein CRT60_00255 [Azospirillum palustre]
MARLKNEMWEKFANAMARGVNQTNSALEAGYSDVSAHVRGCELAKKPDIRARIEELQRKAEKATVAALAVDRQWVLRELVANAEAARTAKNQNAVNRALELVGKELGMFVDRKMDVKSPLDTLNAPQLQAFMEFLTTLTEPSGITIPAPEAMQEMQSHQPAVDLVHSETANAQPV